MTSRKLRQEFLNFFAKKGHKIVPSSSLKPDDPSVLFTTAGMQQFKPYYTDPKKAPAKNVVSIQKCFRTSDIDEVGDESHLTFFEMLGNFSFGGYSPRPSELQPRRSGLQPREGGPSPRPSELRPREGGYFKKEAIELAYEFIAKKLGLKIEYVTIFKGDSEVGRDEESYKVWQSVAPNLDIREHDREENFWGPTGLEGPCGPTTEIYIANSKAESVEVWNIVFNEFYCNVDKSLTNLSTPGVDTGMGLERLAMVVQKKPTIFETDLFAPIMEKFPTRMGEREKRIVADHIRAIAFLIADGVQPSNKEAGYVLRRLIRRVIVHQKIGSKGSFSGKDIYSFDATNLLALVVDNYVDFYKELNKKTIWSVFSEESKRFRKTLDLGLGELKKISSVDAKIAFKLYESYGLPYEVIKELAGNKASNLNRDDFDKEFTKHQEISRAGAGAFKGGLTDHRPQTIKHHTAHHLLLAALRHVLGNHVVQKGSNVSSERLRLDFSHSEKLTEEQLSEVEKLVNQKIAEGLEVKREEMPKERAEKSGALAEFGAKYGDMVSVYTIYEKNGSSFSREFCGGPHVDNTSELGYLKIIKQESLGASVRRIRAVLR